MFTREPDFIITQAGRDSDPYLLRWWVIPRNPWFNIYLHKILRSDDDRALHDHPWWNVSIVLRGGYRELVPENGPAAAHFQRYYVRRTGCVVFRLAKAAHRLVIDPSIAPHAWTLFITGPRIREWGFHCPKGWVHWRRFVGADGGSIGRGCGEQDA